MNPCEKASECWRYSYTQYFADSSKTTNKIPSRSELFFLGYASEKMSETKEKNGNVYYSGIFAKNFPDASGKNFCPAFLGNSCLDCEEYNEDNARNKELAARFADKRKKYKTKYGRELIPLEVRKRVSAKYKYRCVYCSRHLQELKRCGAKGVIDHFISLRSGGVDCESNYVFACSNCNNSKQDQKWEFGCRVGYYKAGDV